MSRRPPILGENRPYVTTCTRMVRGGACGHPGAFHVIWESPLCSVSCAQCADDIRRTYQYEELHPLTEYCTHPVSLWYRDEHRCRPPADGDDVFRGIYLLGK